MYKQYQQPPFSIKGDLMKKMIFAALLAVLSVSAIAQARWFGRGNCCPRPCPTACPPVAGPACEPTPPVCHKTIMVPQTIQVPKVIEVPARRIVMPQQDLCVRTPQPAQRIEIPCPPIPQPNIVKYECVPDKIEYIKQPPLIRYECPPDADQGCPGACPPACPVGCP